MHGTIANVKLLSQFPNASYLSGVSVSQIDVTIFAPYFFLSSATSLFLKAVLAIRKSTHSFERN